LTGVALLPPPPSRFHSADPFVERIGLARYMSSRARRAFLITVLQDANQWQRLVAHGGFVVEHRLEAPLGPDGTDAAEEGAVVLVLVQRTPPAPDQAGSEPAAERVGRSGWRRRRGWRW
jgi:hypothetical protein